MGSHGQWETPDGCRAAAAARVPLLAHVPPSRDDVVQDWDAFMAERRQTTEQERLQQRAHRRKEARHARGLLRKPAGQGPQHGWVPLGCGQL